MPRRLPLSRKLTAQVRQGMQDYIAWHWREKGGPPLKGAIEAEVIRLIRVGGPMIPIPNRWPARGIHRDVYRRCHGPIPEGHEIHHLDGNHDNNSPDNLIAITAEEHREKHPYYRKVPIPLPGAPFYPKP